MGYPIVKTVRERSTAAPTIATLHLFLSGSPRIAVSVRIHAKRARPYPALSMMSWRVSSGFAMLPSYSAYLLMVDDITVLEDEVDKIHLVLECQIHSLEHRALGEEVVVRQRPVRVSVDEGSCIRLVLV